MPIRQIGVQQLVLSLGKYLLKASPACADGLRIVLGTALIDEILRNVLLEIFGVFHSHDDLIVRVKISGHLLSDSRASSSNLGAFRGILGVLRGGGCSFLRILGFRILGRSVTMMMLRSTAVYLCRIIIRIYESSEVIHSLVLTLIPCLCELLGSATVGYFIWSARGSDGIA